MSSRFNRISKICLANSTSGTSSKTSLKTLALNASTSSAYTFAGWNAYKNSNATATPNAGLRVKLDRMLLLGRDIFWLYTTYFHRLEQDLLERCPCSSMPRMQTAKSVAPYKLHCSNYPQLVATQTPTMRNGTGVVQ